MENGFAERVNILGTEYTIELKEEDPGFIRRSVYDICAFVDVVLKRIVVKDNRKSVTCKNNEYELNKLPLIEKKSLRHEIVHAFLYESGLDGSTKSTCAWSRNEEMVDWFALQGPKICEAWKQSGAL